MASTHLVCHLHFGQIEILRTTTLFFQRHSILEESRIGKVGGREPYCHLGAFGFLFVGTLGLHLPLPIRDFLVLNVVVVAERTHHSLDQLSELCLSDTGRTNQMAHLTAQFVIFVVRIHELHVR